MIGNRMGQDNSDLREFLTRTAQPFEWFDAGTEPAAELQSIFGIEADELPALIESSGRVFRHASVRKVAEDWGIRRYPSKLLYDIAIIGAGPAGLAAAVYAASDGLSTVVFDRDVPGGQASHTSMIENFFGFPNGIGGAELAGLAVEQAAGFGAEILQFSELKRVEKPDVMFPGGTMEPGPFELYVDNYGPVSAKMIVAASGMEWRTLNDVPGIESLTGHGVYYGAGRAEAAQCRGDNVIVVGGGNSAGQAAMHLANSGAKVTMMLRSTTITKSMSGYLSARILGHPNIKVSTQCEVKQAYSNGEGQLEAVEDNWETIIPASAMFLCLGGVPRTDWAAKMGVQCTKGFLRTGPDLQSPDGLTCAIAPPGWDLDRSPMALETNIPGFFAAGDVRFGSPRRVGGAVGDGAMAVALAHRVMAE